MNPDLIITLFFNLENTTNKIMAAIMEVRNIFHKPGTKKGKMFHKEATIPTTNPITITLMPIWIVSLLIFILLSFHKMYNTKARLIPQK